jgi:hypothetical protein
MADNTQDDIPYKVANDHMQHVPPLPPSWTYGHPEGGSIFTIPISRIFGEEYAPMISDVLRMVCIHFTIQFMTYVGGGDSSIFSREFIETMLYIVLGVLVFWLVFKRIIWID